MKQLFFIKRNNLRRLMACFHKQDKSLTISQFAERICERNDLTGKYLSGEREIPDETMCRICERLSLPFTYFYDEHPETAWPLQKHSYEDMSEKERLLHVAEGFVEYNKGAKKIDLLTDYIALVRGEILRVIPKEVIHESRILRYFVYGEDPLPHIKL